MAVMSTFLTNKHHSLTYFRNSIEFYENRYNEFAQSKLSRPFHIAGIWQRSRWDSGRKENELFREAGQWKVDWHRQGGLIFMCVG